MTNEIKTSWDRANDVLATILSIEPDHRAARQVIADAIQAAERAAKCCAYARVRNAVAAFMKTPYHACPFCGLYSGMGHYAQCLWLAIERDAKEVADDGR